MNTEEELAKLKNEMVELLNERKEKEYLSKRCDERYYEGMVAGFFITVFAAFFLMLLFS